MAIATNPPDIAPPDGDTLYEVVDGRIVEKTLGTFEADIATLLTGLLVPFVRTHRLGRVMTETLFRIDRATDLRRRPDVAFVSNDRWPWNKRAPKGEPWDMVPDLAIEVVSPSNKANEINTKLQEYFRTGVRQVWVIYPEITQVYLYDSTTQVRILGRNDELDGGPLLPGFRLAVATLFEDEAE
jgi:Uma2 family endonuclease